MPSSRRYSVCLHLERSSGRYSLHLELHLERSSRRYSLHLGRSTSVGDIGSSLNPALSVDDNYIPVITTKKFQQQPAVMKPSQKTNKELKDSRLAERSNATRPSQGPSKPSQNSGNLLKQPVPTMARLTRKSLAKKIDEDEFYGKFIEKCSWCKKNSNPYNDVYVYKDRPFCSLDCRNSWIALNPDLARRIKKEERFEDVY
ncbi:hypothetical protein ACJRO7_032011 [Eucalyptus globulus]|uniref:FLZ-type domain-containing protein n=1 Tax=Eucalyptus globulus TaxID=34317 RepID=A0ABD3JLW7_EUCGL